MLSLMNIKVVDENKPYSQALNRSDKTVRGTLTSQIRELPCENKESLCINCETDTTRNHIHSSSTVPDHKLVQVLQKKCYAQVLSQPVAVQTIISGHTNDPNPRTKRIRNFRLCFRVVQGMALLASRTQTSQHTGYVLCSWTQIYQDAQMTETSRYHMMQANALYASSPHGPSKPPSVVCVVNYIKFVAPSTVSENSQFHT